MTEGEGQRQSYYDQERTRLAQLAWRACSRGNKNTSHVIVLIEVDDPAWRPLVDHLMPNANWQPARDRGERPVARGCVTADVNEAVALIVPDLANALSSPPPQGMWRVIVMGAGGASLYLCVPQPEPAPAPS